jgi:putative Mg2+ transporter-C (MgtC) family protein
MPLHPSWFEIALRLLSSLVAGGLIGWNRSAHGRAAGFRTSILVSLAACVAMIQVNLLLSLSGKSSDSFVTMDLMRLPLGILSGMGFIGAGAIFKRENLIVGVTTAATLWFVTVIGLCFGAGQLILGSIATVIGFLTLTAFKTIEDRTRQDCLGTLSIVVGPAAPPEEEVTNRLAKSGFRVTSCAFFADGQSRELRYDLRWTALPSENSVPPLIHGLVELPGVVRIAWNPQAR